MAFTLNHAGLKEIETVYSKKRGARRVHISGMDECLTIDAYTEDVGAGDGATVDEVKRVQEQTSDIHEAMAKRTRSASTGTFERQKNKPRRAPAIVVGTDEPSSGQSPNH